jgi:hypothetical protein
MKPQANSIALWALGMTTLIATLPVWASPVNYGGSNHFLYAVGKANGFGPGNAWFLPALNVRPVLGTFQLNPALVKAQMQAARESGQNVYVLPVWTAPVAECEDDKCHDGVKDGVWGHVIHYDENGLDEQHQKNLKALISLASELGFKRMIIRFFHNDAMHKANTWDPKLYARIWGYVRNTHTLASGHRDEIGSHMALLYDLAGEFGGVGIGQGQKFNRQLWRDYISTFSNEDTVGFSFAWEPGRISRQRQWYGDTLPKWWAFDIYPGPAKADANLKAAGDPAVKMAESLAAIHREMGTQRNQPIIILETFFNDAAIATGVQKASAENRLMNIDQISQWPSTYGSGHFSVDILATLNKSKGLFQNYLPLLGARMVRYTSSNADVLSVVDGNCAKGKALPCNVTLVLGEPPAGKKNSLFVATPGKAAKNVACRMGGDQAVNWIGEFKQYSFMVFHVDKCPDVMPEGKPAASVELDL